MIGPNTGAGRREEIISSPSASELGSKPERGTVSWQDHTGSVGLKDDKLVYMQGTKILSNF